MKSLKTILLTVIATALAAPAFAASTASPTDLGLVRVATIAARRDVQREDNFTSEEVKALTAMAKYYNAYAGKPLSTADAIALDSSIIGLLTPEQVTRLTQLQIQLSGVRAVFDSSIQTKLGLSTSQVASMTSLTATFKKGAMSPAMLTTKVNTILTASQQSALTALGGVTMVVATTP